MEDRTFEIHFEFGNGLRKWKTFRASSCEAATEDLLDCYPSEYVRVIQVFELDDDYNEVETWVG